MTGNFQNSLYKCERSWNKVKTFLAVEWLMVYKSFSQAHDVFF